MSASYDRPRSLLNLIADALFLADLPTATTTTAITKLNVVDRLNEGAAELYNAILQSGDGAEIFIKRGSITCNARDPSLYDLDASFLKLKYVEYKSSATSGTTIRLRKFGLEDRAMLVTTSARNYDNALIAYRLEGKTTLDDTTGTQIEILPIPPSGAIVAYWYMPVPPRLANDGDMLPGFSGFETYCITYAARSFTLKQENYEATDRLGAELERIKGNILQAMKNRDESEPPRTRMVREQPGRFNRWSGGRGRF